MIAYSQRDSRWSGAKLGTGKPTIGQAGCLLCCAASVLSAYPALPGLPTPLTPDALNRELIARGGFAGGNLFVFGALRAWGVEIEQIVNCEMVPAPMDLIAAARAAGDQVIVKVDSAPGRVVDPHWVVVVDPEASVIMDPWQPSGREFVPLARYLAPGWDAARGIFRVVVYRRTGSERISGYDPAVVRTIRGTGDTVTGAQQETVALWRRPWG